MMLGQMKIRQMKWFADTQAAPGIVGDCGPDMGLANRTENP